MAYYRFELDVENGADPSGENLFASGMFDSGGEAALNGNFGYGPGVSDNQGGYTTCHVSTEPDVQVGYSGYDLTGSELVWFTIIELDASGGALNMYMIGPYTVSDIGTPVN